MADFRQTGGHEAHADAFGLMPDTNPDLRLAGELAEEVGDTGAEAPARSLGARLKQLRSKHGLSQRQVAEDVGIDVTYLSKLENGKQRASDEKLRLLAQVFQVEASELLRLETQVAPDVQAPPIVEIVPEPSRRDVRSFRTRFVDRETATAELGAIWTRGGLLTLSGPPGCGKTRLAAEYIRKLDGPISWLTVEEDDDVDRLGGKLTELGSSHQVVVLDDADLALRASAEIARRLLQGSYEVTVLATSREPLGVYGERLHKLGGLAVPEEYLRPHTGRGLTPDFGKLQQQESVNLFVDRAGLAEPGFQLDADNAGAVFDICRWLDGLPLAIELAAMRLRQMTVMDLAANLDDLLAWLTDNTPDVPRRHAGLEAAVQWSFERLSDVQRTVAARLCTFSVPFNLNDAAEVAADDARTPEQVRATVLALVDRSLLVKRKDADGKASYRWPHPVRQYGLRELAGRPDAAETRERYRSWRWVVTVMGEKLGSVAEWARRADVSPELLADVYRLPAEQQLEAVGRLTSGGVNIAEFGNPNPDTPWLSERLDPQVELPPDVFRDLGVRARVRGEFGPALDYFKYAHQKALAMRDLPGQAETLVDLAQNAVDRGEYQEAEEHVGRVRALYEEVKDRPEGAQAGGAEVEVCNLEGRIALAKGDPAGAAERFQLALDLAGQLDDVRLRAYSLQNLGISDQQLRRLASARQLLKASLDIRLKMGDLRGAAQVVEAFALVEAEMGNHAIAMQLLGAARKYRSFKSAQGISTWWRQQLDEIETEAKSVFASRPEEIDKLLRLGAALSLPEAGDLALQDTTAVPPRPLNGAIAISSVLRRHVAKGCQLVEVTAGGASARSSRKDGKADRSVESGAEDMYRRLRTAGLYALAEPIGDAVEDVLCFAVDPNLHRGVVLPLFTAPEALDEVLPDHPQLTGRKVVSIRLDQLKPPVAGEMIVVNPWATAEYWFSPGESDYLQAESLAST